MTRSGCEMRTPATSAGEDFLARGAVGSVEFWVADLVATLLAVFVATLLADLVAVLLASPRAARFFGAASASISVCCCTSSPLRGASLTIWRAGLSLRRLTNDA